MVSDGDALLRWIPLLPMLAALHARSRDHKLVYKLLGAVTVFAVLFSTSRGSLVALAAALLGWAIGLDGRRRQVVLALSGATLLLGAVLAREEITEIAHTHPGGFLGFSDEDLTTMQAVEAATGKSFTWSIVTEDGYLTRYEGSDSQPDASPSDSMEP